MGNGTQLFSAYALWEQKKNNLGSRIVHLKCWRLVQVWTKSIEIWLCASVYKFCVWTRKLMNKYNVKKTNSKFNAFSQTPSLESVWNCDCCLVGSAGKYFPDLLALQIIKHTSGFALRLARMARWDFMRFQANSTPFLKRHHLNQFETVTAAWLALLEGIFLIC